MEFHADEIKVSGPMASDGSYKISFKTGEYQKLNVAKLMAMTEREKSWTVNVTPYGEEEKALEEELEGRTTQKEANNNKYTKLWALIDELASWEERYKEAKELELKADLGIESFTELSDEELEDTISTLEHDIKMYAQQQLANETD